MAGKRLSALCGLLLASSTPSGATFYSGNELYAKCTNQQSAIDLTLCNGYIVGTFDSMWAEGFDCANTRGVTALQAVDVVRAYLVANPAIRNLPATTLAREALSRAFHCKKN